jgi:hypothetical protein
MSGRLIGNNHIIKLFRREIPGIPGYQFKPVYFGHRCLKSIRETFYLMFLSLVTGTLSG